MKRLIPLLAMTAFAALGASPAAAAPVWNLDLHHAQTNAPPGGQIDYWFDIENMGDADSSGTVTLTITLPSGLKRNGIRRGASVGSDPVNWSCPGAVGDSTITCTTTDPIPRHSSTDTLALTADVGAGLASGIDKFAKVVVSGGGAASASPTGFEQTHIDSTPAGFGIMGETFLPDFTESDGHTPVRQAGSHPYFLTVPFDFNTVDNPTVSDSFEKNASEPIRDLKVDLPPGFVGNPTAVAECSAAHIFAADCPASSQLGVARVRTITFEGTQGPSQSFTNFVRPIYNMSHPRGVLTDLAFVIAGNPVHIIASLDPTNHYAITTSVSNINETLPVFHQKVTFWGVPADKNHDSERCSTGNAPRFTTGKECSTDQALKPFLTAPGRCDSESNFRLHHYDSWDHPGAYGPEINQDLGQFSGCDQIPFAPTVSVAPTTNAADSPSGLDVGIGVPQNDTCDPGPPVDCGIASSPLKDATVTLPEGLTVNPASANGLGACTPAQISLGTDDPVTCPDASKIAEAQVTTPLLSDPVQGTVYLASQNDNPFDTLLAAYIVFFDPDRGILIKVAGKIDVDPDTGRLTGSFKDNPDLPFSNLQLHFKAGAHAALITPKTCGDYSSNADFAPWSGNADVPGSSNFTISTAAAGGACPADPASLPNAPSFDAGPVSPISAHYSPFVLHLRRDDGTQRFGAFNVTLPKGMTGKLAGTALCPDGALDAARAKSGKEEQSDPSCSLDSHVGTVVAGAGAGPSPFYAKGDAYLAGPYKGAPLSLAVIVPAVAGPFDLGTIVVRTPLQIDPTTAQISALSDPIPQSLEGIPTDVRSVDVVLDKPDFTLTGTSCDPASVDGLLTPELGSPAALSVRYQLSDCDRLGFKPSLKLSLKGATLRNGHPAFTTTIAYPSGDYSNLASAQVTLPKQIQLDQSHIQAPCTRPQFAAGQCPDASIIGTATAISPLLDYPLSGPVYLRTGGNPLPDVVLALKGPPSQPIEIDQVGKVDTQNARLRTTFDSIPDAPLSSAVVSLVGGSKGLLVNNSSLCAKPDIANLRLIAHDGDFIHPSAKVAIKCPKGHKHKAHKKHHKRQRRTASR